MTKYIPTIALALALGACAAQQAQINAAQQQAGTVMSNVVADGQLFCQKVAPFAPGVLAVVNAVDSSAVTVTNKAAGWVAAVCATVNAIPVPPPATPTPVPVQAVTVAPAVVAKS